MYGFSHIYHRFYDFCYSPVYFSYYRLIISVNLLQTLDQNSPPTNIYFWLFGCNDNSWQVFYSLSCAGNNPLIHNFFKEKIVNSKHFKSFWELDKQMSGNRLKIPLLYQQKLLIKHCFRGKSLPVQPPQKGNMIPEKMTKIGTNNDIPESNCCKDAI